MQQISTEHPNIHCPKLEQKHHLPYMTNHAQLKYRTTIRIQIRCYKYLPTFLVILLTISSPPLIIPLAATLSRIAKPLSLKNYSSPKILCCRVPSYMSLFQFFIAYGTFAVRYIFTHVLSIFRSIALSCSSTCALSAYIYFILVWSTLHLYNPFDIYSTSLHLLL